MFFKKSEENVETKESPENVPESAEAKESPENASENAEAKESPENASENAEAKESEGATVAKASLPINIPKPTHREYDSLLGYEAGYFMGRQAKPNTFDDEYSSGSEDELIFKIDDVIFGSKKLDNHPASKPKPKPIS